MEGAGMPLFFMEDIMKDEEIIMIEIEEDPWELWQDEGGEG